MPWDTAAWTQITDEIILAPMTSIATMDSKISARTTGRIKPRSISNCFTTYIDNGGAVTQERFVNKIIPMMQSLLKNAPRVFKQVHVLKQLVNTNVALTRTQCATLIVCMWFEIFRYDYVGENASIKLMPYVTFAHIFENNNMFAFACLINYFDRVCDELNTDKFNNREVIFKRKCVQSNIISSLDTPLPEISLGDGFVDDSPSHVHCISASASLGGVDLLAGSPTVEHVVLLTRPECLVGTLLCARLLPGETLTVFGAEKMAIHRGIGSSVIFVSNYADKVKIGRAGSAKCAQIAVVFMDASTHADGRSQLVDNFDRDLTKAYCGMVSVPLDTISCANWTHGFNGANMQLRFIQQLLAAGYAAKNMIYHPATQDFDSCVEQFILWLQDSDLSCNDLYRMYKDVVDIDSSRLSEFNIFDALR